MNACSFRARSAIISSVNQPESEDAGITRAYRRVLIVWVVVLAGLWWLQHAFV